MSFLEKNWKTITTVFLIFVFVGVLTILLSGQSEKKEMLAQEKYFLTEKKYLELKNKKDNPVIAANEENTKTTKSDKKDKKPETQTTTEVVIDFSQVKSEFEKVIADYSGSKAAQMSALYVTEILKSESKEVEALALLQKVQTNDSGLVNSLVQQKIAQLLADQDKCKEALQIWDKILQRKEAQFAHNDLKIQQALCYKKMNDLKKAEEILTNLANQKSEESPEPSTTSKEAEKYLRLIQFKKMSGT